jgi:choline-sulfatase
VPFCVRSRNGTRRLDARAVHERPRRQRGRARLWGKSTFYEESAGVPLIVAGPGVAREASSQPRFRTSTARRRSRSDGVDPRAGDGPLPGASLFAVAQGASPARPVISEYHAIGSAAGAFMLRFGKWKYCHYVAYRPQLFDLESDPEELTDLGDDDRFADVLAQGERLLRSTLDPDAVDARAKKRQQQLLETFGGRDAALARGDLGFTPAPGTPAEMN